MQHHLPFSQTLTSYSSIISMAVGTPECGPFGAVSEVGLTASTVNIVQVDCAHTLTKMSIVEGHRI